ncbi:MAG: glucose-6-phosphate isomerase, partial [Betaproteobacteria bacterium]|nr:glucose-6-phosphate isomerase [Betaproteobacteria bacterium]
MSDLTRTTAWTALQQHQHAVAPLHLRDLFARDPGRFERFSLQAGPLFLDYSKNRITDETLTLLLALARESQLPEWIERLFRGERVNGTEHRAALHTALRHQGKAPVLLDGTDVMPAVRRVQDQMRRFSESVRSGEWRGYTGQPMTDVINIGIGGS